VEAVAEVAFGTLATERVRNNLVIILCWGAVRGIGSIPERDSLLEGVEPGGDSGSSYAIASPGTEVVLLLLEVGLVVTRDRNGV